ncbi:MAG: response regulator [Parvibaculum sp.]|nr:response regulator [Parvibaculum sp.]
MKVRFGTPGDSLRSPGGEMQAPPLMPRVLIFDDDTAILDVVTRLLTDAGYDVVRGQPGRGARKQVGRSNYDILLTDIYMPDIDGIELVRAAREARPDVPIVCMSGGTYKLSAEFSLSLSGAFDVEQLPKPFGRTELLLALQTALGRGGTQPGASKSCHASR